MDHNLHFIVLIESKRETIAAVMLMKIWGRSDFGFYFVPSVGSSGGIVMSWNSALITCAVVSTGSRWILLNISNRICLHILVVYGHNDGIERAILWSELLSIIAPLNNLILCGDFNEVLDANERSNGIYSNFIHDFQAFVNESELLDLPLHGRNYTLA